jgi:hypothetical protein
LSSFSGDSASNAAAKRALFLFLLNEKLLSDSNIRYVLGSFTRNINLSGYCGIGDQVREINPNIGILFILFRPLLALASFVLPLSPSTCHAAPGYLTRGFVVLGKNAAI